jgi:prepilin-type N-terminal cleavage/methylation domain-containing protein
MTSPVSASGKPVRRTPLAALHRRGRGGFTLIEMLVVIGIILVLAGLLLPSLAGAYRSAQRTAMAADLNAIGVALEAYKKDFGSYPRVVKDPATTVIDPTHPNPMLGAQMLAFALMGPARATDPAATANARLIQDGADGFGFRVQRTAGNDGNLNTPDDVMQGKTYPPYLQSDRFKCMDPMDDAAPAQTNNIADTHALRFCLLDRNNKPILYFPASSAHPNVKIAPAVAGAPAPYVDSSIATGNASEGSLYDGDDNLMWFTNDPTTYASAAMTAAASQPDKDISLKRIRVLLGETKTANGVIENGETPVDLPFLLWSAGPDEKFGPVDLSTASPTALEDSDAAVIRKCDDVTNFPR